MASLNKLAIPSLHRIPRLQVRVPSAPSETGLEPEAKHQLLIDRIHALNGT